jgi:DNA-binding transcriptional ArsR family regulator
MASQEPTPVQGQRAMAHPMRARILAALDGRELSPVEMARDLEASLGVVSYHVRVLADAGVVELARTTARRGAIQHHYRLRDNAAVSGSVSLSKERADRLAGELRKVVDKARREAAKATEGGGDVEVTVLVHRVALT